MVFRGYNQQSGKMSLRASSGLMSPGAMRDSVSGDLAAFFGGGVLLRKHEGGIEIRQSDGDSPVIVSVKDDACGPLGLMRRWMFPQHACGMAQFIVSPVPGDEHTFGHFTFDSSGTPAAANVAYLGAVRAEAFHAEVDFQAQSKPGDRNPYLWPLKTVTALTTNKGKITITNQYSPKK